jgi:sigma-B regulation protein RsbU (phosphoserine phosphatase)
VTDQPQVSGEVGGRQLLKLGEQLMAAPTLAARCDLIVAILGRLLEGRADLWLDKAFHRLPGLRALPSFPPLPASELMRSALDARRVVRGEELPAQAPPWVVAAPLLVNENLLGVVQVDRQQGAPFSDAEIELLKGVALQAAIALQATFQVETERWRVEQLSLVRMVSAQIASLLDLDELLRRVAQLVLATFEYYYVALFTLEPAEGSLRFRASAGPRRAQPQGNRRSRTVLHARLGEGIIGYVAQTGDEVVANDVGAEPRYHYEDALPETQSEVALPLKIESRILGVLDVQSDQPNDFHATDLLVLRALAHNISIAVEDARLYSDLRQRADQLAAVAEVSGAVASILDLDALLEEIVAFIHQRFGYPFVHLFTVHTGRRQIVYQAGSGRRSQALRDRGLTYSVDDPQGILPWVARQGETVLANDVSHEPRYRPSELPPTNTRSELAVPLIFGGQVLGVLDVQSDRKNAFSEDDRFLFEALADNVAIAIRNAGLYRSERWRRQVADSLREVAGLLSANLALSDVLDAILSELGRTLTCDAAAIWLLQEGTLRQSAVHGCTGDETIRIGDLLVESSAWLDQALHADQPTIRRPESPLDPLGAALKLSADYSAIATPLRVGDRRLGLLVLAHHEPGRYGSESQAMTAAFAGYAAVAIENTRLYEAAQEQAWISTVLLQVAEATQSLTSLDQVLEAVIRLMSMLVGVQRCALLLSSRPEESEHKGGAPLLPVIAYGLTPLQQAFFDRWRPAPGEVPALEHLRLTKLPVIIEHAANDARLPASIVSDLGFESLLILPLLARGELLGAMLMDYSSGMGQEFGQERLAMIQGIAHQTAAAVENARLLETRQEEAYVSTALLQVAQAVVSLNDLDDILGAIVRITPMLVGVEWCIVFLWYEEASIFRPCQAYGIPRSVELELRSRQYEAGEFPFLDAIRESDQLSTLDVFSDWEDLTPLGFAEDFVTLVRSGVAGRNGVHSLVAVPLSVKGVGLGVMLVEESRTSSRFRERRLELLTGIAQQAAIAVQNDLLQQEMAERERLEQELQLAHDIQQTFMPSQLPDLAGWELAVTWRAARQVAGDFYDFFDLPSGRLGLVIADVADKGMGAALFMALTRALVRAAALENVSPAAALARVNELLIPDTQQGMFVTIIYAVLYLETGELAYANAGHNLPLLFRLRPQGLERLSRGGMALGVLQGIRYEEYFVELGPGDFLVFYTDGITEAFSAEGQMFGEERLRAAIQAADAGTAQAMLDAIDAAVADFTRDSSPSDDMTLMVLHRVLPQG